MNEPAPHFDLSEHLSQEHASTPFTENLKEIVYGGMDGIVTTFAVVAGFAGAGNQIEGLVGTTVVLLFGLANLFADGLSMGLGNFLSIKSEKDLYRSHREKEILEIKNNPTMEGIETKEILISKGYQVEDAEKMVALYQKNPKFWTDFMMDYELEISNPENNNEYLKSFATFFSFVFFGAIPLIPYFFTIPTEQYFSISILATGFALTLLGLLRWKITKIRLFRSFFDTFAIGGVAAAVAYLVGTFFRF